MNRIKFWCSHFFRMLGSSFFAAAIFMFLNSNVFDTHLFEVLDVSDGFSPSLFFCYVLSCLAYIILIYSVLFNLMYMPVICSLGGTRKGFLLSSMICYGLLGLLILTISALVWHWQPDTYGASALERLPFLFAICFSTIGIIVFLGSIISKKVTFGFILLCVLSFAWSMWIIYALSEDLYLHVAPWLCVLLGLGVYSGAGFASWLIMGKTEVKL